MAAGAAVKGVGGKKGRSGRKSKAEELGLKALLDKCFNRQQRQEVIRTLYRAALEGNIPAATLLMAYTFGKPTEKIEATITHREFEVDIGGDASQSEREPEFVN